MTATNQTEVFKPEIAANPKPATTSDGQVFEFDGTVIRVESGSFRSMAEPHIVGNEGTVESITTISPDWQPDQSNIGLDFRNVFQNNASLQQAAREMAKSIVETQPSTHRPLRIEPAWEVPAFRWPRIINRFLNSHGEIFEQMGAALMSQLQATRSRIGISSTHPSEGKTTVAICLARWAARNGQKTLLIDADVENPQLTIRSGLNPNVSWKQAIDLDFPLSEIMVRSAESGLVVMPARADQRPTFHEKSLDELSTILFQLKYEFDVLIVDVGSVENICVHGSEGMDLVDLMLLVRDAHQTSIGQLMEAQQVLRNLGMTRTMIAENFSHQPAA